MIRWRLIVSLLAALAAWPAGAARQEPCRATAPPVSREPNFFTPSQESDLGDVVAEGIEATLRILDDDALTGPLQAIGDRLVRHLPATALRFRFRLIDLPDANAFVLPGGRVYVSRKLIAVTRSEDELANVLGHELGHLVARQQALAVTRQLRDLLGVTEVGDLADIRAKYNQLLDNAARKPGVFRDGGHGTRDQIEADRIGLFVVAAAGYDAQAHAALFDRIAETGGKTGSFFSRLFGTTSPDAKRLGEMIRAAGALPAACAASRVAPDMTAFEAWRIAVVSARPGGRRESLRGVISQTALVPFRGEIAHVRFSPDGRHLLAQDATGIVVLSREPLAERFRIETTGVEPARFSADSRDVLVHTADMRLERWRVTDGRLVDVSDLVGRSACVATAVAPDGRTFACVGEDSDLVVVDVATAQPILRRKGFYRVNFNDLLLGLFSAASGKLTAGGLMLRFSPDGRYFAAGYSGFGGASQLVYDLTARAPIELKSAARSLMAATFAFAGPDRLVGLNITQPGRSGVIQLPSGDVVEQFALPLGLLDAPTADGYVFVRPYQQFAVGVFDVATKRVVTANPTEAVDAHGQTIAAERGVGDLTILGLESDTPVAALALPATRLPRVQAAAVSADLQWVAVSERTRGAMWNVGTGQRAALIRAFDGGVMDAGGVLFADMPQAGGEPRAIVRVDAPARQIAVTGEIAERGAAVYGRWLLTARYTPPTRFPAERAEFELRDVRQPKPLWTRPYARHVPHMVWMAADSDAVVLGWAAESPEGRERIRINQDLRDRARLGDLQGDYVFEVLDAQTGDVRGRMLIETGKGSFVVVDVTVAGDAVLVSDSLGRVLVYSLAAGELKGHAFGEKPVVHAGAGLFAVTTGAGRVVLYDLSTMARREELTFTHETPVMAFSADGQRLLVVTTDHRAHVLSVGK